MESVNLRSHRSAAWHRSLAALAVGAVVVATVGATAGGSSAPTLASATAGNFPGALTNAKGHTLYVLSTEKEAKIHCVGSCLSTWIPLEVATSVKVLTLGAHVKGVIGFVARTKSTKQVTFNSYPLYTDTKDGAAGSTKGEAVSADGGTWLMVHASATSAKTTPYEPILQSVSASSYHSILGASSGDSLYLLSSEKGATIRCSTGCTSIWYPVLVTSTTSALAVGQGVKGTIGFVKRSSSTKQVTFNSYPVYRYSGDSAPGMVNGQGIAADGGTWWLVSAGATSAASSPVTSPSSSGGGWARRRP